MTHASRDTMSGLLFEQRVSGKAPGIPLHKAALRQYYEKETGEYYSLSKMSPGKNNGIPHDKLERAEKFEGKFLFTRALEPDEAYLDKELSTLTIFEKKFQDTNGSADEKIQTCGFKIKQYRKLAERLGIKNVYFIYILSDWFKNPYYRDALEFIESIEGCSYYFCDSLPSISRRPNGS